MTSLLAAAAFFVLIHLLVSGTRVRDALVGRIGEGPYMGLFSLASLAGIVWLSLAFGRARSAPGNELIWGAASVLRWVQVGLQLGAVSLVVLGLSTPNPTSVRQEAALDRPVQGVLRITRHPFLCGVAIWAIGHLLVNGDVASMVLFASMLLLTLFGTVSIDAKRRRALGSKWDAFAAQTSIIPFLAIAQGRQRLNIGEIGAWRLLLAVGVWAALLLGHPHLVGVPALP
ncbi:NnrU family protein [Phenylobacterium deserti]|uniref:NnrU family protein n=1 Tax=Phenylobacterium deserti TaxID=1914756 RepID=A0A328AC45_9CAUL|nr:NnrU family protein [Phenylobacterium deserti]RAK52373.1 NnrU family protein [Phenylobacterium deserti]